MCVAIVVSVALLKQNLDSRSRAQIATRCNTTDQPQIGTSSATSIAQAEQRLVNTTQTVADAAQKNQTTFFGSNSQAEIAQAARERKAALITMMRTNPEQALKHILPRQARDEAEVVTDNCIEQPVSVEGVFDAVVLDNFEGSSQTLYTVTSTTGEKISLHIANPKLNQITPNAKVKLQGFKLDRDMLIDQSKADSIQVLSPTSIQQSADFSPIATSMGSQQVAVILVKMQGSPDSTVTSSQINSTIMQSIDRFYRENSYNKTSLNWKTFGWYTINNHTSCSSMSDIGQILNESLNAAIQDVDIQKYSRFIFFLTDATNMGCTFDGIGSIGLAPLNTPSGTVSRSWALALMKDKTRSTYWQTMIAGHELGHNFGVGHASSWRCGSQALAASGCVKDVEYGDIFNIMGNDFLHMDAFHKEFIGWLTSAQVSTVTTNGTYQIEPIETATNGVKAIKIPRGGGDFLYVEFRQPIGQDASMNRGQPGDVYEGALLHVLLPENHTGIVDASPPYSELVTMTPSLKRGQSVIDPVSGARITVSDVSNSRLVVDVAFGSSSNITPTVPSTTPSVSPSTTQAAPSPTATIPPLVATPTLLPTPTLIPGRAALSLTVKLRGIGSGVGYNSNPVSSQIPVSAQIYNLSNQKVFEGHAIASYQAASNGFTGTLNSTVTPGQYYIKLRLNGTLWKKASGILTVVSGNNTVPPIQLTTGDLDGDNHLTIIDHSIFVHCYTVSCPERGMMDFNLDGKIDGADYNILILSYANRDGD